MSCMTPPKTENDHEYGGTPLASVAPELFMSKLTEVTPGKSRRAAKHESAVVSAGIDVEFD